MVNIWLKLGAELQNPDADGALLPVTKTQQIAAVVGNRNPASIGQAIRLAGDGTGEDPGVEPQ